MTRVRGGVVTRRRHKRMLKRAKGYKFSRSKRFKSAKETVMKAERYSRHGRKERKRQMRSLWIVRIGAAARARGMTYARLIQGLTKAKVALNRPSLARIAFEDPQAFDALAQIAAKN